MPEEDKNKDRSFQKARSLASSNRGLANEAERNVERFQAEVENLNAEIASIRIPRNATSDVKEELKNRRKELKEQLEYAQSRLDNALKKSESLKNVADYYESRLGKINRDIPSEATSEEDKAAIIAAIKAKQKADIKASEEAREKREALIRSEKERIATEKEAVRKAAEKEAARVAVQEAAEREAELLRQQKEAAIEAERTESEREAQRIAAEKEAACVALQEESDRIAQKEAEIRALKSTCDDDLVSEPGEQSDREQSDVSDRKSKKGFICILILMIAIAVMLFLVLRHPKEAEIPSVQSTAAVVTVQPEVIPVGETPVVSEPVEDVEDEKFSFENIICLVPDSGVSVDDSFEYTYTRTNESVQIDEPEASYVTEDVMTSASEDGTPGLTYEFNFKGYKATFTAYDGMALIDYPDFITEQEVHAACQAACESYPLYLKNVRLYVADEGHAILTYPEGCTYKNFVFATQMLEVLLPIYIMSLYD